MFIFEADRKYALSIYTKILKFLKYDAIGFFEGIRLLLTFDPRRHLFANFEDVVSVHAKGTHLAFLRLDLFFGAESVVALEKFEVGLHNYYLSNLCKRNC